MTGLTRHGAQFILAAGFELRLSEWNGSVCRLEDVDIFEKDHEALEPDATTKARLKSLGLRPKSVNAAHTMRWGAIRGDAIIAPKSRIVCI